MCIVSGPLRNDLPAFLKLCILRLYDSYSFFTAASGILVRMVNTGVSCRSLRYPSYFPKSSIFMISCMIRLSSISLSTMNYRVLHRKNRSCDYPEQDLLPQVHRPQTPLPPPRYAPMLLIFGIRNGYTGGMAVAVGRELESASHTVIIREMSAGPPLKGTIRS